MPSFYCSGPALKNGLTNEPVGFHIYLETMLPQCP